MNAASVEMLGVMVAGSTVPGIPSVSVSEEGSKKIRKPYTITKSRESWTEQEHDKFLEALQLFDRDWKKIEAFVGSKTVIQIRSHAQKYFLKVQKNGTGEHVPPPRPKRKSAQPYPQKAPKCVPAQVQVSDGLNAQAVQAESSYGTGSHVPPMSSASPSVSAWVQHSVSPNPSISYDAPGIKSEVEGVSLTAVRASSNSISGSSPGGWPQHVLPASQIAPESCIRAAPDFTEVYKFIGSVFDPGVSGHLRKLKEMSPIDRETVLLLMRNLSINLASPDFEEHDTGEDTSSVSGQAGTPQSNALLVSPRSGDADHTQQRASLLLAYSDNTADAGTPRRHSYDGGGAISASYTSSGVSPSPGDLEPVSLGPPSAALQPQIPVLTMKPERVYSAPSLPSLTSLPSLPAGLVDGSVDTWWT
ncbi:protein REVEILLE 3 isoform X6 [Physcomitrium patens]|uniref:Uncharacterized protein n=2 Tax=Physcomitrium patens TaxID=3218 RepID=A0A7I4AC33_PHYPA|nr:protein REVEILLE 3-like isoform X5 [Physcomitrium patens]|eukprot:XP_024389910.1 protein REVEILLE 3-like isoform X5 [Physcomitrella patens]